jgi:hypothetical protein
MPYTPGVLNPKAFLTGGRKMYIFLGGKATLLMLFLYSDMPHTSPTFQLAQDIFEPNLFLYKYPNNLVPVILPAYAAYEDGTECFETSEHKSRRRAITQKKEYNIQNKAKV